MLGSPTYDHGEQEIEINAGRPSVKLLVSNTGDRAIQIGSHFHFFETNKALLFERELAYGMHLDVPAGTGIRIEAGDTKEVTLTAYAGNRRVIGFNNLVDGGLDSAATKIRAMDRMNELKFQNGKPNAKPSAGNTGNPAKTGNAGEGKK
ncbi:MULTISPECIES: urease subunit beta [unclassified Arthrobacter]|uniref:urease subunit beta n=1 Tax=unclassified Arthrobacter TaxID=235627 RepID=UPI001D149B66|nr:MULTISPECIES: urease subunit beta [unclassified Arthrobacter]MCC3274374.1 urease subunit beta [Arthrobacter sp. zg-Y20]MCC3279631.1 urease subunit beta [Arthrobacter sp. zg-Y40]MCC9178032.1 urease subunit beta [Arthrobacter sp. zg-Y750]MDK1314530.1 urease subunit beta [Arthrobacter sp. zg.Y20]MDK1327418.1 urease subunit beta [Arthrobacter sp. zg-Y1143]